VDYASVTSIIHCRLCCNLIISWPVTDRRWRTSSLTTGLYFMTDLELLSLTRPTSVWSIIFTHNLTPLKRDQSCVHVCWSRHACAILVDNILLTPVHLVDSDSRSVTDGLSRVMK